MKPWQEPRPHLLSEIREDLLREFPDLHVVVENGSVFVRGSFPVDHKGKVLDRYQVEIQLPPDYPNSTPIVREVGSRIPRIADRHVHPATGEACVIVPEEWLLRADHDSILSFFNGPVRDFFLGQSLFEVDGKWPFDERTHGIKGLYESYGEILGFSEPPAIRRCLEYLSKEQIKGHWDCPCGSGKRLRHCHSDGIRALQQRMSRRIAKKALDRIASLERGASK